MALPFDPTKKKRPPGPLPLRSQASSTESRFTKIKIFEDGPKPELAQEIEQSNRVQSSSLEVNKVQEKGSLGFNQSGSIEAEKVHNKVQSGSIEANQSSSLEVNRVQIGSMNPNEPSIGEAKVLRWLNEKKLEDLTVFFRAEECSAQTGLTREGSKTAIKRLRGKGFLELVEARRGRYTAFGLYRLTTKAEDFLLKKSSTPVPFNWVQSSSIGFNNRVQIGSNSSSNLLNTTTIQIPEPLRTVISPKEIEVLLSQNLISETDLTQSLEHFSYDYSNGLVKSKNSPVSLFYGLSRTGKVYRSVKLLELENQELRDYEKSLQAVEVENQRLKQLDLKKKFEEFKKQNPDYVESVKKKNSFISTDQMAEKIAFSTWQQEQGASDV